MKRSTTLLLPLLLLVLASCGTTAQYSQQRFQDGIYAKPGEEPEIVHLYSEEDFEAMAAQNIARKQQGSRDTLVVVLDDPWGYSWRSPFYWGWGGLGFGSYYWNRWHYRGWYDPWYYDPWFGPYYGIGWYDPWYYDPWYGPYYGGYYGYGWYDPWYGPYGGYGWYDPWYSRGWGGHHRNSVYTQRSLTEAGGSRTTRPGSGYNYRYGTPGSAGGSFIGSRSGSNTVRRSQSGVRTGSSTVPSTSRRREEGYNYSRTYPNRNAGSNTRQSTGESRAQTRSYNNNTGSYSSGASRSYGGGGGGYSSGGGFGGGGSSSHSGGGGGGSRGGGGRR